MIGSYQRVLVVVSLKLVNGGYILVIHYIEVQEVDLFVIMNFPWTWDNHENFTGMYTKPTAQTHMLYMYIFLMIMFDYVSVYDR